SPKYLYAPRRSHWPRPTLPSFRGVVTPNIPPRVKIRPRTFCQWKSPPKLICSTWTSFDRKISVDPPSVSSLGWLKLLTKSVSSLISGVKNLESHTTSLLCGLPFIQLQSANAKGSDLAGFSGLVAGGADVDWSCGGAGPAVAAVSAGVGAKVGAGVGAGSVAFARPAGMSVVVPR